MWKWIAPVVLATASSTLAQQQPTAYDALRAVSTRLGRPALNHVISITGTNGDPQPETWKVLLDDPNAAGGVREVEVRGGRVTVERTPERMVIGGGRHATIQTARLNLDSSGAFQVANRTADRSNTRFASANYTLKMGERGDPVWIVTLLSPEEQPVGTIHINCNRGNVVRTEGMFAGATMQDVVTDKTFRREERTEVRSERGGDDNDDNDGDDERGPLYGVRHRIRDSFFRAQDEARGMFDRVRRSFTDFINRG